MPLIKEEKMREDKKIGDSWPGVIAPEEFRYWTEGAEWDPEDLRGYGMSMQRAEFRAVKTISKYDATKYTSRSPLVFRCGAECIDGRKSTGSVNDRHRYYLDGGIAVINDQLLELSRNNGITSWQTTRLNLTLIRHGLISLWGVFNPSGEKKGDVLAFGYGWINGKKTAFYDMDKTWLDRIVGKFKDKVIGCCIYPPGKAPEGIRGCLDLHSKDIKKFDAKKTKEIIISSRTIKNKR